MQNDCAQNTLDISVAQAQETHLCKGSKNHMYEYWRVSSKLSPGASLINSHTHQASALNAQLVQTLGWYDPYQKTHTRGKEANSQYKWPNGPQVWILYTKAAHTLQKEATTIAANHMKHQLNWHTNTTKYERLPNTALQIAATKSLRFRPGSRTDKKFSRMGQKTLTLQSP